MYLTLPLFYKIGPVWELKKVPKLFFSVIAQIICYI